MPSGTVMEGNGLIPRLEPSGHDSMKGDASVNTARGPRELSKAPGMGSLLPATRMKV